MTRLTPVILSGGSGSRLWPLSREAYPKQLLSLFGGETLLQATAGRAADPARFKPLIVVANAEHRFAVAEQLQALKVPVGRIVLEPFGRNTGPAAAVAALLALENDPGAVLLIMPADHSVGDVAGFMGAVEAGRAAAERGDLVLFGIRATQPVTGYGYIQLGGPLPGIIGVQKVARFTEKPDAAMAERYVASGDYVWNSGIFLLAAATLIDELDRLEPQLVEACREAIAKAATDLDFLRLDAKPFQRARSVSIDYALLENTDRAVVVPADFGWSDIGAWSAVWELGQKDASGNVITGEAVTVNARGCYVHSDGPVVALSGVDDLIVIATGDAVLVTSKSGDQDVKVVVDRLKNNGHAAATQSLRVHRPWGFYQSIHNGERFQVKRITVNPGAKLSLQKHFHRAEHWVVVNGTALVTRDNEHILLRENESTFLPLGCVHRLENPGQIPLNLIEVQSGPYLGEDDIVRLDDVYARA
jgi:mannose-1-phosphate guanylyltransferase/mannose-1-phosphate guanylyltransferase/mannose-6-phosphate isomerase